MQNWQKFFKSAGYIVKQPPKIAGARLNLWAIGTDEVLYMGLTDSHNGDITAAEGGESKWRGANGGIVHQSSMENVQRNGKSPRTIS